MGGRQKGSGMEQFTKAHDENGHLITTLQEGVSCDYRRMHGRGDYNNIWHPVLSPVYALCKEIERCLCNCALSTDYSHICRVICFLASLILCYTLVHKYLSHKYRLCPGETGRGDLKETCHQQPAGSIFSSVPLVVPESGLNSLNIPVVASLCAAGRMC